MQRPQILAVQRPPDFYLVAVVGLAVAIGGFAVSEFPLIALGTAGLTLAVGAASLNPEGAERIVALTLLCGVMILGRGWANLGIPGAIPIPATEILFVPLAAIALMNRPTRLDPRILLPLCLFAILVTIRLFFDYPVWRIFAIRDTTPAIEAFILLIGYRAVMRDGIDAWVRRMRYVAFIVLIYGTLYPFISTAGVTGPTVGLQRDAPLFDPTGVKFSVIAMSLYFWIFGKNWGKYLSLGLAMGLLAQYQARSLYLMLPLAILVAGWATRSVLRTVVRIIPAVVIAGLIVLWASANAIQGTEGPVSTDFLSSHLNTLTGAEGPNHKTIDARQDFFSRTVSEVVQNPGTLIVGLGLGPDLTFGQWIGKEGQLVRNPHNSYLETFARTGLLGLSLWLWVLLGCLVPIARRARSGSGTSETFCAWVLAAVVVYLGVAAVQPILAFPYGSVPLFFLLGMGVAAARSNFETPEPPPSVLLSSKPAFGSSAV
jgi:O-antigen ligase